MVDSQKIKVGDIIIPSARKYPDGALYVTSVEGDVIEAHPMGGGFGYKFPPEAQKKYDFRVVTDAERSNPTWARARFGLDESPTWFGWDCGERWNGWRCPWFEKSEAQSILAYFGAHNHTVEYREADDTFSIKFEDDDPYEAKGEDIKVAPDKTLHLYRVGDGFTWEEIPDPTECEVCDGVALNADKTCPKCGVSHAGEPCDKCRRFGSHRDECDAAPTRDTEGGPAYVAPEDRESEEKEHNRALRELAGDFEKAYQYYKGWGFEFEHPGVFCYYQLGGDIRVYFTPDWSDKGKVDVQVNNGNGETFAHIGKRHAFTDLNAPYKLFAIVKPYLDIIGDRTSAELERIF